MSKLPLKKLGELIIESKDQYGSEKLNGIQVLSVTNDRGFIKSEKRTSENVSNYKIIKSGFFAYNPYRINVGSLAFAASDYAGIVSPAYVVFHCANDLDPEYLWKYLKSDVGLFQIRQGGKGSVRSSLSFERLQKIEIPLPPLPEQKRIIKKIKEIEKVSKKIKELQNYDTGTIIRSFSDSYFSNKFEEKTFKEIFSVTKLAGFEYTKHYEFIEKPEIIALRAQNVKNEGLKLNQIKYISKKLSDFLVRSKLNKNDIVVTFIGAGTGEAALIDEDNKYHCAPNIAKLTVKNQKEIYPHFALAQIRSPFVQDQIINITRQTAQPSLSMKIIRVLKFKVPPKEKQIEYMDKLNNFKKSIGALKLEKEKRNSYLTALVPSITAKAFNGELL